MAMGFVRHRLPSRLKTKADAASFRSGLRRGLWATSDVPVMVLLLMELGHTRTILSALTPRILGLTWPRSRQLQLV